MDFQGTPFYKSERAIGDRGSSPAHRTLRRPPPSGPDTTERGIPLSDTIHLHDLTPTERLVEEAAERGFVEEKELEAFADAHELAEDDRAALRAALHEREVRGRADTDPARASPATRTAAPPRPRPALPPTASGPHRPARRGLTLAPWTPSSKGRFSSHHP